MKLNEPRPIAPSDAVTEPWWHETRQGRFTVQRCTVCGRTQFYPRAICTRCGALDLELIDASGRGTVYSYTVVRRAPHPAFEPPYVVAMVRLEEGELLLTNIVGVEPDAIRCDMPVRLVWEELPDGRKLPLFTGE